MSDNELTQTVDRATNATWFERTARAGHVVSGLLHLLIAYLILRVALGQGAEADQSGALATVADTTGGAITLWVAAVAFVAMALWRLAEAAIGVHATEPNEHKFRASDLLDRGKALSLAVIFAGFAFSAAQFALGRGGSSSAQNAGLSARLMSSNPGKAVLVVVGLIIVAVGIYHVYKGVSTQFMDDLNIDEGRLVLVTGVVGYVAKGVVLAGAGILVIVAVFRADPAKAAGLDAAVKTFRDVPAGQFLLLAAALGVAAYGIYSFVMARYSRM